MKAIIFLLSCLFIVSCSSTQIDFVLTEDLYEKDHLWFLRFEPIEGKNVKVYLDGYQILDQIDKAPQYGYIAIYDLNMKLKDKNIKVVIK